MTEYEILQYIKDVKDENGNAVFTPSNDTKLFKVDGQNIVMPCSFYRKVIVDGEEYFENFKVRAANHGGWFSRWEEDKELKPWLNKQNIDIVFAPFSATHSNLKANTFFVIQQYVYDSNEITIKKLKRIINAVLNIGKNDFSDPLGTARYRVLRPTNDKDELIPVPTDKSVNEYQIEVLREYEESENGNHANESLCMPKHILSFDEFSLLEKYEVYGHGIEFKTKTGSTIKSVVSLKDEYGGKTHIAIDDGCYILYNGDDEKGFVISSWIYPEAHAALKELPNLPVY